LNLLRNFAQLTIEYAITLTKHYGVKSRTWGNLLLVPWTDAVRLIDLLAQSGAFVVGFSCFNDFNIESASVSHDDYLEEHPTDILGLAELVKKSLLLYFDGGNDVTWVELDVSFHK
jgi:hypothetical protein